VALSRLKLGFESRWGQQYTRAWWSRSAGLVVFLGLVTGCPSTAQRQLEAGHAAAKAGQWPKALEAYQAASVAEPSNAKARSLVGVAAVSVGNGGLAATAFSEALALDATLVEARIGLAQLAVEGADAGAALSLLETHSVPQARLVRARALLLRGGTDDAAQALQEAQAALGQAPTSPGRYLEGSALLALGRYAEAQAAFEGLERADTSSPMGPYGLARVAAAQRRGTDALLYLKAARSRAGARWSAAEISKDPAFAFLAGAAGFTEVVGP
jgi:tetratricopeptide (TPR) repeat protein